MDNKGVRNSRQRLTKKKGGRGKSPNDPPSLRGVNGQDRSLRGKIQFGREPLQLSMGGRTFGLSKTLARSAGEIAQAHPCDSRVRQSRGKKGKTRGGERLESIPVRLLIFPPCSQSRRPPGGQLGGKNLCRGGKGVVTLKKNPCKPRVVNDCALTM